jgi:hypothetical protein
MTLLGRGFLAIWNDVAEGSDAEVDQWYIREHAPERVGLPGFLRGRRFVAIDGRPKYFTLYETESAKVLASPSYLARLNDPTPWSRKALQLFRNTNRTACDLTRSLGQGTGGVMATLRLASAPARDAALRTWLSDSALPATVAEPGVVAVALGEADLSATRVPTAERSLRDRDDEVAAWVVLVEGIDAESVEAAVTRHLGHAALERAGAAPGSIPGHYCLQYALLH